MYAEGICIYFNTRKKTLRRNKSVENKIAATHAYGFFAVTIIFITAVISITMIIIMMKYYYDWIKGNSVMRSGVAARN